MSGADAMDHLVIGFDTKHPPEHEPGHALPTLDARHASLGLGPPPGATEEAFVNRWLRPIEQSLYLHSGSRYILEAWRERRECLEPGGQVCLRGVLDTLEGKLSDAKGWAKQAQHLDSAVNALGRLCRATELFSGVVCLDWRRRFTHSHQLMLRGQTAEAI